MKIHQAQTFVPSLQTRTAQTETPVKPEPSELDTLIGPEHHIDGNTLIRMGITSGRSSLEASGSP